jgi:WD40 repeat protein/transcriptional regulator with XRE-family HTH domain
MTTPADLPDVGQGRVDPALLTTREEFATTLTALRHRLGLTVRDVSRRTGIPSATLGGYFSGRHLPPLSQAESYEALILALGVPASEVDAWRTALIRLRQLAGPRPGGDVPPFRGLMRFDIGDAEWFVGREVATADLVHRVRRAAEATSDPHFLALVGASGSGKSSLLRAGLLAQLIAEGHRVTVFQPGADPVRALADARDSLGDASTDAAAVLAVDQFEEIFDARVDDHDRDRFIETLSRIARGSGRLVVVIAVRADFYGRCVSEPELLALLRDRQALVGAMDRESLRRAVIEPAAKVGRKVEPELIETLLHDLAPRGVEAEAYDPAALPLFSHALLAVWQRSAGSTLGVSQYVATGGIAGAIQTTAEHAFGGLTTDQQDFVRRLFSALVTVDDEGLATRRRIAHEDVEETDDDAAVEAIETLVRSRILTATEHTLEISHEALLTAWPRLADWLESDREDLQLRRRVSVAARDWNQHGRADTALLQGPVLELSQRLVAPGQRRITLTPLERDFLERSTEQEAVRAAVRRRGRRRLKVLLASTAALALLAMTLSAYLYKTVDVVDRQRTEAEVAHDQALSRQMAAEAAQLRETDPALAMQLSLAAYERYPTVEARSSLLEVTGTPAVSRMVGPEGVLKSAASADGRTIATVAADGFARFWDREGTAAPKLVGKAPIAKGSALFAGTFSNDGRLFAAGGVDGLATVLDVTDPAHPRRVVEVGGGPDAVIEDLAFSADGRVLYAATGGPSLLRYRLDGSTATPLPATTGFGGTVQGVALSRAGLVATASADGFVRLWKPDGQRLSLVRALPAGTTTNFVYSVAFSPDGRLLAAGAKDKRVRVWDVSGTPRLVTDRLTGFTSWVNGVAFSPDGTMLAGAASGNLTQVWATRDWRQVRSFPGPTNYTSVQFLPSGRGLVTGSLDGIGRVWSLDGPRLAAFGDTIWSLAVPADGRRLYVGVGSADPHVYVGDVTDPGAARLVGHLTDGPESAGVFAGVAAVSADGRLVAGGTATGRLLVWSPVDRPEAPPVVLPTATALIENVFFSSDGHYLGATSDDGSISVYDARGPGTPTLERALKIKGLAFGLAFSPDDKVVATSGSDKLVHLFDRASGRELATLEGFTNYAYTVAFSPDGSILAAAGADRTVRLWDVTDPAHPRTLGSPLRGPTDTMFNIAWNRAGNLLGAASKDGKLWLWSVKDRTARLYAHLGNLPGAPLQVLPSPTSDVFYAAGSNGAVGSWRSSVAAARELVCSVSGTPMSRVEWKLYAPGADYRQPCREQG